MADAETIPLLLTAGPVGSGSLNLRFPPEYASEIQALLDENDIGHSVAAEFSDGPALAIEAVTVVAGAIGTAGGIGGVAAGLASIYKTFVHRHDGKRIIISKDGDIDVSGFSLKKTEEIIERQVAAQAQRDAQWFESIEADSPDQ